MNTNCRRRLRSTIKWGGAVLTVLLLIVSVTSAWWDYLIDFGIAFGVADGAFQVICPARAKTSWWSGDIPDGDFVWWFGIGTFRFLTTTYFSFVIPIWFVLLLAVTTTILFWRLDRNLRLLEAIHTCLNCGYTRTGLPTDRACPECGAAVALR